MANQRQADMFVQVRLLRSGSSGKVRVTRVPASTLAAYYAAIYEIGSLRLRIGEDNDAASSLLRDKNVKSAAIVTAYNPESVPLCEAENRAAHENLRHATVQYASLPTRAIDPTDVWPPEQGVLLLGITVDAAVALGQKFRQNAIVWIVPDEAPKLVLLR